MGTRQSEAGLTVVEGFGLFPVRFIMAITALCAHTAFVNVRGLMAVYALTGCVSEFTWSRMARFAARAFVGAAQIEVAEGVIECFPIELNDIGGAALVLGVARIALGFRGLLLLAVETAPVRSIICGCLMTGQAKLRLPWLRKRFVAVRTGRFELGMRLRQRSRHDEVLEYGLRQR